jgi:hypothetical protein
MLSLPTLHRLRQFDTPTICNLIELFDVRPRNTGYMDGRIMAVFPEMLPIVGFAATATIRSGAPPRRGDAYGDLGQQVERFGSLSGPPTPALLSAARAEKAERVRQPEQRVSRQHKGG